MELWEFNACVRAHNRRSRETAKEQIILAWHIANFTGAAFVGKLKPLNTYLKDAGTKCAPQISKEEFDEKLKRLERRNG